jgi:hypothetical protein
VTKSSILSPLVHGPHNMHLSTRGLRWVSPLRRCAVHLLFKMLSLELSCGSFLVKCTRYLAVLSIRPVHILFESRKTRSKLSFLEHIRQEAIKHHRIHSFLHHLHWVQGDPGYLKVCIARDRVANSCLRHRST